MGPSRYPVPAALIVGGAILASACSFINAPDGDRVVLVDDMNAVRCP